MAPELLISEGLFTLLVYGSTIGVGVTVAVIIGIWLKELKNKSVW